MIDYNDLLKDTNRFNQMKTLPGSVTHKQLSSQLIFNSSVATGTVSLANGSLLTLTTTFKGNPNQDVRLSALPFQIAFFQGTATLANQIPLINVTGYTLVGPHAMPQLSPVWSDITRTGIGTDGNNLVFRTWLYNNTGSTQTIIYYTQARIISPEISAT